MRPNEAWWESVEWVEADLVGLFGIDMGCLGKVLWGWVRIGYSAGTERDLCRDI